MSAGLAVLFACGSEINPDQEQPDSIPRPNSFAEAGQATSGLRSDEVLGVVIASSRATTDFNNLARVRSRDPLVIAFAERSIAIQPHDQRLLDAALDRLGLAPVDTPASDRLNQRAQEIMIMLQQQGVDFDRAFLESQVAVQREVIQIMDESNVCSRIPIAGCSGFGRTSFVGGLREEPLPLDFDEQSLFTRMRSTFVSSLTDASVLSTLLITPSQP